MTVKLKKKEPSVFGSLTLKESQAMLDKAVAYGKNRAKWAAASKTLVEAKDK